MFVTEYANDNGTAPKVKRRGRSVSIAKRKTAVVRKCFYGVVRSRRGIQTFIPSLWRRSDPGTNRISGLGIWRPGTRRTACRANREGATDWHRPYRTGDAGARGSLIRAS